MIFQKFSFLAVTDQTWEHFNDFGGTSLFDQSVLVSYKAVCRTAPASTKLKEIDKISSTYIVCFPALASYVKKAIQKTLYVCNQSVRKVPDLTHCIGRLKQLLPLSCLLFNILCIVRFS